MSFLRDVVFSYRVVRNILYHKLDKSYPITIIIWPTYRCNHRCIFCDAYKKHVKKELTTQEILEIIDQMDRLKIPLCVISGGGEPLMRKDIIQIGEYLIEKNIKSSICTNGSLITKKMAKELVNSYERISISLHGFEKTHDYITRTKGSFSSTMKGIKNLNSVKKNNIINVNFVLNKYNYREVIPFTKFLLKKKIVDFIAILPINTVKMLSPPLNEIKIIVDELLKIKRKHPDFIRHTPEYLNKIVEYFSGKKFHCEAGDLFCVVSPEGNVFPCYTIGISIGNLRNQKLKRILKSEKMKKFKSMRERCEGCLFEFTNEISNIVSLPPTKLFKMAPEIIRREYIDFSITKFMYRCLSYF